MQVCLNHSRYPSADMATDFAKEQYAGVYKSFCDFARIYFGINNLLAGSQVNPAAYKALQSMCLMYQSRVSDSLQRCNFVRMYLRIHKPTPWLSVFECLNVKARDQRCASYSRRDVRSRWSTWRKYW